ncbi:restriction endonuclease subunit S [uncultured Maribacter sp.]|uniref:restriction endonuclease subunit S n=1 Tax=uncultured Maribacter sp. TaxID=431308 RepID=UPI0030D920F5|tara:strand:+ start:8477 stop:9790 length:1314 start_codon:yes stop_codon:yes gene_type:complete
MKQYETYKDSGEEWIGEIPTEWGMTRIGNLSELTVPQRDKPKDLKGEIPWLRIEDFESKYVSTSKSNQGVSIETVKSMNLKVYPVGTVLTACSCTMGKTAIVREPLITNQTFIGITPNQNLESEYLYYFLISSTQYLNSIASGAIQSYLSRSEFSKLKIPKISIVEQTKIANYLNHKTAHLDTLIAKKEHLINLLQEERTSMINQAVTKGIDSTVIMKDSGIEWLGEIPEHWVNYRIDWITTIVRGNTGFKKDELLESGEYVALQYGKTYKVDIVDESFKFFVNNEFYKQSQIVSRGDTILISTSETVEDLGHTCYYDKENIGLLGGEQILLKPNRKILSEKYLYHYAGQFCLEMRRYAKGLKVFRFNTNNLKQIFIAIPSLEEQILIADYLDRETIRISEVISRTKKEIELLKEYKTSLISEVVTGKVDVRGEVYN